METQDLPPEYFSKYSVSVAMVFKHRIYISKRNSDAKTFPSTWQFVGGKLNSDTENPIDGAVRELEEETGIQIDQKRLKYIGPVVDDPATGGVCYIYYVELFEGEYPKQIEPDKMGPWYLFKMDIVQKFNIMPGMLRAIGNLRVLYDE